MTNAKSSPANRIHTELLLLRERWHIILLGLAFQYVHGIFTQLAYHMHQPAAHPLHDVGFEIIPELPASARWVSEAIFTMLLLLFVAWTFTPLLARRSFSTVVLWTRLLTVLVVCQSLRILSFSSTQLPGPALHCHGDQPTATIEPVSAWWQYLIVDVGRQAAHSCGDLIFSSHMTFILTGMLAYSHYGCKPLFKAVSWAAGAVLAVLIIAARKHYTVDVVIAWYTVPMVYTLLHVWWHYKNAARSGVCGLCGGHSSCSYNCTAGEDEKSDMQAPGTGIGSRKGLGFNNTSSSNGGSDSSGSAVCEIILPTSGGTFGGVGSPSGSSGGGKGKSRAAAAAASPRRLLGPWWFGRGPWRQQLQRHVQQLAKADSGAAVDMEAQVLLPQRELSAGRVLELQDCLNR